MLLGQGLRTNLKLYFNAGHNDFGFIRAEVSGVVSYKRNVGYNLSCPLQTCCLLSIIEKQFVSGQFFFLDLWRNQRWQGLEEGRCKPVLGVRHSAPLVEILGQCVHVQHDIRLQSRSV